VKTQLAGELASYEAEKPWRERQEQEDQPLKEDRGADLHDDEPIAEKAATPQEPATPRKKRRPFD
jgi:hypothetical protein